MNNLIKRIHSNFYLVKDVDKTLGFYQQLGFDAELKDNAVRVKLNDFTLCFMDENKTDIPDEAGLTPKGLGIYTYIEVTDVDEYYKTILDNGITPETEPKTWPWGKREFVIKDPDGFKLVFYSSVNI